MLPKEHPEQKSWNRHWVTCSIPLNLHSRNVDFLILRKFHVGSNIIEWLFLILFFQADKEKFILNHFHIYMLQHTEHNTILICIKFEHSSTEYKLNTHTQSINIVI